jgi:hypothetical protein
MSIPLQNANCPGCGAPVLFRWEHSIQTTCPYCKSVLVRTDVDLKLIGRIGDLPLESSPIQIGSEGQYRGKPFHAIGRILYEYDQGIWNEWHIVFSDNTSGWLSDAQLEYDVSFLTAPPAPLPGPQDVQLGMNFRWFDADFQVTNLTRAHYRGVEGELPFQYWDKHVVLFADLRTTTGRFATIDYSEREPLLFTGEAVEFDDLKLRDLRAFAGWTI